MSDSFNQNGWLLDFADASRSLHLLCEQWLYHHGYYHADGGECEACEDVEAILRALRESRFLIKWEGVFDRRFLCPKCGVTPHWDAGQEERDEVCLHVCRQCGSVVEDRHTKPEAKPSDEAALLRGVRRREDGWG